MNEYPEAPGGLPLRVFRCCLLLALGLMLAACGKEGPFGDTPGPKKPVWHYDQGVLR